MLDRYSLSSVIFRMSRLTETIYAMYGIAREGSLLAPIPQIEQLHDRNMYDMMLMYCMYNTVAYIGWGR